MKDEKIYDCRFTIVNAEVTFCILTSDFCISSAFILHPSSLPPVKPFFKLALAQVYHGRSAVSAGVW